MKWIRYYADVIPAKRIVLIRKQVYDSNNKRGMFRKKNLVVTTVETKIIEGDIPFEEVDIDVEHFDSRAMQSDDRFFTTKKRIKRYNQDVIKSIAEKSLIGYNTEPELLTT